MKTVDLPLHTGRCPRWLFKRMVKLSGAIAEIIIGEYGRVEFLRRLSNPMFFQALSCVIGFDWHSSGTTTTTLGALKTALEKREQGIRICGGKGKNALKTPEEIEQKGEEAGLGWKRIEEMKRNSKLCAKIDGGCIQDGYVLYHHNFIFEEGGSWMVVEQGINERKRYARRYHWNVKRNERVEADNPESKIIGMEKKERVLNTSGRKSRENRKASLNLLEEISEKLEYRRYVFPEEHSIRKEFLRKSEIEFLKKIGELKPENYEEMILFRGMGPKKIRALALLAKTIYGCEPDWEDPIMYSYAHGGKDGIPYPVDRKLYDENVEFLKEMIGGSEIRKEEKREAMKRLVKYTGNFIINKK